ncbi:hypothetical protein PENTCL1PPCAC_14724, partial [Pristionchus entomophagus]
RNHYPLAATQMSCRYDIVVYGATGFTGGYIVRALATSAQFKGKTIAVAGRSEEKLRALLEELTRETGVHDVSQYEVLIADSSNEESLAAMARQARVIINAVGPYILYGEAVVRAAVENGACHVDISGEPAFLERMVQKYDKAAREKGVYIVGACGFDSIPCDLGTEFLKRNFEGTLAYVETFARMNQGSAGYPVNTGTYESMLLGVSSLLDRNVRQVHREIMSDPMPQPKYTIPFRIPLSRQPLPKALAWCVPFPFADKPIVDRSQYYDFHVNNKRVVQISSYITLGSLFKTILSIIWLSVISFFALFSRSREFLKAHPEMCSFGMFRRNGPTKQQIGEASFDYFIFGTGWGQGEEVDKERPAKKVVAVCHGPDPGYVGTSACITSAALALLDDNEKLPKEGGVYTTATAFRETQIFEYLRNMGVTFAIQDREKKEGQLL